MKPEMIVLAERLVLLAGAVAIVTALSAWEWRVGLLAAGVLMIVATSPWRNMR